jgi:hypothetical protein
MKKLLISLLFIAVTCFSVNVYAGIGVTPARGELVIEKEQTYEGFYTLESDFDSPIDVAITVATWNNSPENKDVDINDWFSLPLKSIRLDAGEKAEIKYFVKSGNYKGSLSAMISFTHKSPGHQGISLMTSIPFYLTIDGTQNIDFDISSMRVEKEPRMTNYTVAYLVYNAGNIPVRVKGDLKVMKGKKIIVSHRIREQSPVYAGLNRAFYESLQSLPKGKYKLNISLNALGKTVEKSIQIRVNKYGDIAYSK